MRKSAFPFIALGAAFITIGLTSNRTFLFLGLVFIFIGLAQLARARRG